MTEKILIPLDGSESDESAVYQVTKLLHDIKPGVTTEVVLFRLVKPPVKYIPVEGGIVEIPGDEDELKLKRRAAMRYLQGIARTLRETGINAIPKVVVYEPGAGKADMIVKAETELGGNLVAMTIPEKHGLKHWSSRRTAEKVIDNGSIPVILVPA